MRLNREGCVWQADSDAPPQEVCGESRRFGRVKCDVASWPRVSAQPNVRSATHCMCVHRVDYDKITHLASHERNVTKMHYLTVCVDAMHR